MDLMYSHAQPFDSSSLPGLELEKCGARGKAIAGMEWARRVRLAFWVDRGCVWKGG